MAFWSSSACVCAVDQHACSTTCCNALVVWQEIGADETVNYREQDFAEVYKDKPFDYIFDSVGGEHMSGSDT